MNVERDFRIMEASLNMMNILENPTMINVARKIHAIKDMLIKEQEKFAHSLKDCVVSIM